MIRRLGFPIDNGLNFLQIHWQAIVRDDIAQKIDV